MLTFLICIVVFECTPEEFKCIMGGKCINSALVCDGLPDCIDMSDEFHCGEYK